MAGHGGARKGAGRKKTNKPLTKVNIYKSDRDLINGYAFSKGIPVNLLMNKIFRNEKFEDFLNTIE